ncbi:hypothetical protein PNEG_00407 [Pneumocystis murina B123]|uniref:Sec20 C-terminal domain-containing protein n=1 Tax=Pneumocystis murina (strain B123) TaxID=1069680 RepID=M7NVQ8_PNEMU|nr:hypothetical protein PNEG_00407 [Pneumocystis murina B123]EMR11382.1 hypothetical protein PNEG_00407 [Pneumocystis murina B123]
MKSRYLEICNKLKEDLKIARIDFRKALLKSNKNINLTFQKNQEQLLGDTKERVTLLQRKRENMKSSTGDRVINTSTNVLSALVELHQLMESEMSRSSVTLEELELSSNALQSLQENYLTFNTLLTKSRKLISELEYSNKFDRISIIFSLILFLSVIAWIIYRRLLHHIVRFTFWFFFVKLRNIGKKIIKTRSNEYFLINIFILIIVGKFSVSDSLKVPENSIIQKSKPIFSYSKNYTGDFLEFNTIYKSDIANSTFLHDEL